MISNNKAMTIFIQSIKANRGWKDLEERTFLLNPANYDDNISFYDYKDVPKQFIEMFNIEIKPTEILIIIKRLSFHTKISTFLCIASNYSIEKIYVSSSTTTTLMPENTTLKYEASLSNIRKSIIDKW